MKLFITSEKSVIAEIVEIVYCNGHHIHFQDL